LDDRQIQYGTEIELPGHSVDMTGWQKGSQPHVADGARDIARDQETWAAATAIGSNAIAQRHDRTPLRVIEFGPPLTCIMREYVHLLPDGGNIT
jgi:hypothetical protein